MKTFLFLLILIPNLSFSQKEKIKYWSEKDTLQFEDFKGVYKKQDSNSADATSILTIKLESVKNNNTFFNVYALFNINRSSFFKIKSFYVLKHEQLHFDITELFTRKIRNEFYNSYKKNTKTKLTDLYSIYNKYITLYRNFQKKYDLETSYTRNFQNQQKWNKKVKIELENLKEFSNEKYLEKMKRLLNNKN